MKLIIPAAGKSSRFPNVRPKWMLTHPNGNMMVIEAIRGLDLSNVTEIILIVLEEHLDQYRLEEYAIQEQLRAINDKLPLTILQLEKPTLSQPETIYQAIKQLDISGPIFIKDCDNYFATKLEPGNSIIFSDLNHHASINAANKSYIEIDRLGNIYNIAEKSVISSAFCVGGYGFHEAQFFAAEFERLQDLKDLYVSHIIKSLLMQNHCFIANSCSNYVDWGTLEEWKKYTSEYTTLFVDIDGVLVENSSEYFTPQWGTTEGLHRNIAIINEAYNSGKSYIVLTTSRKESWSQTTLDQLERVGVKYHKIIFGLPHAKRIIINDYSKTNPFRSCEAINLPRNSDSLEDFMAVIK